MMKNLKEIYNREFFQEWGPHHEKYVDSAENVTDVLYRFLSPFSVVDVGCGCGVYSHFFQKKGVRVLSLDGVRPPKEESFPVSITVRDFTVPFDNTWGKFDVALCLEVAEHIPENLSSAFLRNITSLSDRLVLSAAPPGQGGHHHVNEQPKRYWVKRLAEYGFFYNRKLTGQIMETFKREKISYMWMGEHISIYDRAKPQDSLKRELPFQTRVPLKI